MGKKGHSEEKVLRVLREAESGDTGGGDLPQAWESASRRSTCGKRSTRVWG